MNRFYKILTVIMLSGFISGSAFAFNGFSIGVLGSSSDFDTKGSETEGAGDKETNYGEISKSVDYGAGFIEYTIGSGNTGAGGFALTVGAEYIPGAASLGTKSRTDVTVDGNEANQDDNTYTAKAEVENARTFYLEPTFTFTDNLGFYVKGGITQVDVTSLEDIASGTDSSVYGDETIDGMMYGVGLRGQLANGIGVKIEYVAVEYDEVKLTSTTGNLNVIKATPKEKSTRIGLYYNF
tara:strand:- start:2197 stop:2910 length:714 start_codon:yes stop_codon:yes gene_type:complete